MVHIKPNATSCMATTSPAHPSRRAISLGVALVLVALVSTLSIGVRHALAEDTSGLAYEVKLCLDTSSALDGDLQPVKSLSDAFGFDGTHKDNSNLFLETPERDYQAQGWINRVRLKTGKKPKLEITYKRRYKVEGDDLAGAIERAASEGFVVQDTTDAYSAELDWGYESMTLSFSNKASLASADIDDLAQLPADEIRQAVRDNMVAEEANWVSEGWGTSLVDKAEFAGPLTYHKYSGMWKETEISLEVWPIPDATNGGTTYITEISFEADDYDHTATTRAELISLLDELQVLVHTDSLKTSAVLDAYLGTGTNTEPDDDPAKDDASEKDDSSDPDGEGDDKDDHGDSSDSDGKTDDKDGHDDSSSQDDKDDGVGSDTTDGSAIPIPGHTIVRPTPISGITTGLWRDTLPPSNGHRPLGEPERTGNTTTTTQVTPDRPTLAQTPETGTTTQYISTTSAVPEAAAATQASAPAQPSTTQAQLSTVPVTASQVAAPLPLAATTDATDGASACLACLSLACLSLAVRYKAGHAA